MRHEKEFKCINGDILKAEVSIWVDGLRSNDFGYSYQLYIKRKGKRKFETMSNYENNISYMTFIETAKTELWQKLRP